MQCHTTPRRVNPWHRLAPALILALLLASLTAEAVKAQAPVRFVNRNVNDGLVSYWAFDESIGSTIRDIARLPDPGSPGTLSGGATLDGGEKPPPEEGLNQSNLLLNGTDGKMVVADPSGRLNLATAFTVAAQVKRAVDDGAGVLYSSGTNAGAWYIGFSADGHLVLGADAQILATSGSTLPIGQWVYVFVVKDSTGAVRFYLNGTPDGAGSAGALVQPSGEKTIGGRPGDPTAPWQGRLDTFSVYSQALTAAQIARLSTFSSLCATDGTSWATAYRLLTCALQSTSSGVEVWIAHGIYVPGTMGDNSFQLQNTVDLYGGFVGTETSRSQRPQFVQPSSVNFDASSYTVLSGDVSGDDDRTAFTNVNDNVNHVLTGDGVNVPTLLDGLVVSGGNANTSALENAVGGGLLNRGGSLTLSNIAFVANGAYSGAGVAHFYTNLRLANVLFLANQAINSGGGSGGGVYVQDGSVNLANSKFAQNHAQAGAGLAVKHTDGAPATEAIIAQSQFDGNEAGQRGGAVLLLGAPNVRLTDVTFTGNKAAEGAAVAAENSAAAFAKVEWNSNTATNSGGGVYGIGSSLQFTTTLFAGNKAATAGAIYRQGGSMSVSEATFSGNQASGNAGAVYLEGAGGVVMNRVLLYANRSGGSGGGILAAGTTDFRVYNAVAVGNTAVNGAALAGQNAMLKVSNVTAVGNTSTGGATISADGASTGAVRNTLAWGNSAAAAISAPPAVGVSNNMPETSDPKFKRMASAGDGNWDTLGDNDYGDLSVNQGSPAIDAGDNGALTDSTITVTTDVKGISRRWDDSSKPDTGIGTPPLVDIGAHEFIDAVPIAVAGGPYASVEGTPVTVTAAGSSTPVGTIVQYEWDCQDDGNFEIAVQTATAACAYSDDGTFTARLRVTAANNGVIGGTAEDTAIVVVANAPPIYTAPGPQIALAGTQKSFNLGSFVDAGIEDKWQISINWGDGSPGGDYGTDQQGDIRQIEHTYAALGQYVVHVSVRDEDGGVTSGQFNVTATQANADSDGDGRLDIDECLPDNPCPDTDRDGIPDYLDPDDDGDGIPTTGEGQVDTDSDGIPDYLDPDDDNDTVLTVSEPTGDLDGDGIPNYLDPDDDGDGRPTIVEHGRDDNHNGVPDEYEAGHIVMLPLLRR